MSDKDLAIKQAMANAKASIEIEGLIVTKESEELVFKKLMGEISEEDFLKGALEIATRVKD